MFFAQGWPVKQGHLSLEQFWALTRRAAFQGEHILLHTKDMRFFGLVDPWENVPKMSSALSTSK